MRRETSRDPPRSPEPLKNHCFYALSRFGLTKPLKMAISSHTSFKSWFLACISLEKMRVRSKTEATVRHFAVIIGLPLEFCCDNWPPARKNGVSFSRNELPLGAVPQSWPPARPPEAPRGLPRPPEARLVTQLLLEIKGCQHLPKMWLPGSPPPWASRGLPRPPRTLKKLLLFMLCHVLAFPNH